MSSPDRPRLKSGLSVFHSTSTDEKSMKSNSWSNVPAESFHVRQPNYSKLKQKNASEPALYNCIAVDVYQSNKKLGHIGRCIEFPLNHSGNSDQSITSLHTESELNDKYLPPYIIINFSIPSYPVENAIWGKNPEDGIGYNLIMYYSLSEDIKKLLKIRRDRINAANAAAAAAANSHHSKHNKKNKKNKHKKNQSQENNNNHQQSQSSSSSTPASSQLTNNNNSSSNNNADASGDDGVDENKNSEDDEELPNSVRLMHRFTAQDTDTDLRLRFKCISRIINVDEAGIGGAAKKLVQTYNGTPFLIKTTSVFHHGEQYFEADVDVHRFSYLARLGLSGVRERIKDVIFDLAFLIEGHEESELPEQILSAQRLSKLDLSAAQTFPDEFLPDEHKS